MKTNETLVLTGLSRGREAKLRRIHLGWRQIDLASLAKVAVQEVTSLEYDRYVLPRSLNRMLYWLEMQLYFHPHWPLEKVQKDMDELFKEQQRAYWEVNGAH